MKEPTERFHHQLAAGQPRESCGVFGIHGHPRASELAFFGLYALQHRGQESAGIVARGPDGLVGHNGMGLAGDVFTPDILKRLDGSAAIGHVRYSTTGSSNVKNAQPILVDYARGQLAVGHNGNLVNAVALRKELEDCGSIFQSTTDSEIIVHLMARPFNGTFEQALAYSVQRLHGAFSLVMLTRDVLAGVRDPHGIRPLSIGILDGAYVLSSETCAFDLVGAKFVRDVEPGEIVFISDKGIQSVKYAPQARKALCIFEYVYFARPDSVIDGRLCHLVRKELGRELAREFPVSADVVIAVPDSGSSAGLGFSEESGIPFDFGYIRNHYVGRTFISPSQVDRDMKVKVKLNLMPAMVKDKRVVIVDDSIIRGTTTFSRIIELKKAGAKEVHLRISCPPTRFPCYYGVDFPSQEMLIAARHTIAEIAQYLNVDSLGYLSLDGMVKACGGGTHFCRACYEGGYPVPIEEPSQKDIMERARRMRERERPAGVAEAYVKQSSLPQQAKTAATAQQAKTAATAQPTVDAASAVAPTRAAPKPRRRKRKDEPAAQTPAEEKAAVLTPEPQAERHADKPAKKRKGTSSEPDLFG
ncbi:amidophosphoribosyltransferase [bacterium]|nr:amidophosphoribosyltransferase [bacterium]